MSEKMTTQSSAARYAEEVSKIPFLTPDRERALGQRILEKPDDVEARNELVRAHLAYAKRVARGAWLRYDNRKKMPLEDLEQEANLGLMRAAKDYDYRVCSFATYADWWIRGYIQIAMANSGLIRIPLSAQRANQKVAAAMRQLTDTLKRAPTAQEVMSATDLPYVAVRRALGGGTFGITSLETPLKDDSVATLHDILPSGSHPTGEHLYEARLELRAAKQRLSRIYEDVQRYCTPREKEAFHVLYGSGTTGETKSLEEAASALDNVSRQRVHQLIAAVWKKLDYKGRIGWGNDPVTTEKNRIAELEELLAAADMPQQANKA